MFDATKRAIRNHLDAQVDPEIKRLIAAATFDLYFGPSGSMSPTATVGNTRALTPPAT